MVTLGVQASLVSSNDVIGAVTAWTSANGSTFSGGGTPVSAKAVRSDDGKTVLYWIVSLSDGRAVIASPDSDLDLVVAIVDNLDANGNFPAGHPLPDILKRDMANRLAVISQRNATASSGTVRRPLSAASLSTATTLPSDVAESMALANAQWAKYGVGGTKSAIQTRAAALIGEDESPYVRRIVDGFENGGRYTHWNQGAVGGSPCYNKFTPQNAVCGCVATAGSALLQFFGCTNDVGAVHGNPTYGVNGEAVSAPYNITKPGAIDWSILPKSYGGAREGSDILDDAGRDLLGRVAFNMGVLVDMGWDMQGPGTESGAVLARIVGALKAHGFATARHVEFDVQDQARNTQQFAKTIYAQVWCGAPVALGIRGSGGHAVIACGYARDPDGDEFCRVFMGWGGGSDAWYKLPSVSSFSIVTDAITMIGYQDDAVVPVYGSANIPGVDLTVPGYMTNGVAVTAPVNANGYFGVRVPPSMSELKIAYVPRGKSADINPFDSTVLADEASDLESLEGAIPDEISMSILNMDVRYTLEAAKTAALRDGKAILMVSGQAGGERSNALMEYIYWLDDTTDISNRFVLVYSNVKSTEANRPDGDPSIGVFDPNVFEPDGRWTESNGRLAYENFILPDETYETGDVVYSFSATNTVAISNAVPALVETGYDSYLRRTSGISVTVTGVDFASESNAAYEIGMVSPGYGANENAWTNGETVVFTAPSAVTNVAEGKIVSCLGWTTNAVPDTGISSNYNEGAEAELQLFADDNVVLTWVWNVSHYRVTAKAYANGSDVVGAVDPAESWVEVGDYVTIKANDYVLDSYGFSGWDIRSLTKGEWNVSATGGDSRLLDVNGTAITFAVDEPVEVLAEYREGATPPETRTYTFTLKASPEEMQPELPPPAGFEWGGNVSYSYAAKFKPGASSYTDATGGVWVCAGWITENNISGVETNLVQELMAYTMGEITCLWELKSETVELDDISITGVSQMADGNWIVTVSGAVAGGWYWLYATDNLAEFAGEESAWTQVAGLAQPAAGDENPKQATESGDISFKVEPGDGKLFWRARATVSEDGDQ